MISWPYIAGFFDGEGSAFQQRGGSLRVSFCQSKNYRGHETMLAIQAFLRNQGIIARMIDYGLSKAHLGKSEMLNLYLTGERAELFCENVLPYLNVKKVLVQDCLRYRKAFPPIHQTLRAAVCGMRRGDKTIRKIQSNREAM